MKKILYSLFAIASVGTACNNEQANKEPDFSVGETAIPAVSNTKNCYLGHSGRDSVTLTVITEGDKISGNLFYNFYEKDKSRGSISGEMKGDTLIADYSFTSEGMQSLRQVAFLKTADGFKEGYGDMEEKDGKMIFKNRAHLQFGNGFLLAKTDCQQ